MPRVVLETVSFSCCLVVSARRSYWEKTEFSHEGSDTVIIALKDYSPSAIFNRTSEPGHRSGKNSMMDRSIE